ncbi:MAG: dihydropteroate synthase [delta proteobacterium ML8_D]|jgi:dihydropteroate synthase|nr:MAG: dihydropteroate synthase [delta proteobacterium ML8_D]
MALPIFTRKEHTFHWGSRTYIMGVINVTPDSFSDGGKFYSTESVKRHAVSLISAGADILDIGGESTRPFAEPVTLEEELRRVIPAVREIRKISDCLISVDTVKAGVAQAALYEGADIINDISALRFDPKMADVVSSFEAMVVLMHMKGSPRDMQINPYYEDVVGEVRDFLGKRIAWTISRGIPKEKILIDPGLGFGKNFQDNLVLINCLQEFNDLGVPVMVGASRKAFLGAVTGIKAAKERDIATLGAIAVSVMKGVDMVRVHNVALTRQVVQVVDAICRESL